MTETEDVLKVRIELLEARLDDLITLLIPCRIQKLEERLNLLMALRQNKLDLSKFIFQLEPL